MLRFIWPAAMLLALAFGPGCALYNDGPGDAPPAPGSSWPEQIGAALIGAGWGAGECAGYCRNVLWLGADGTADFERISWDGTEPPFLAVGRLSELGALQLRSVSDGLARQPLAETYGCPDCDDGGAAWVEVLRGDQVSRSSYELGLPPAVLAAADAFTDGVMDALRDCVSSELIVVERCPGL